MIILLHHYLSLVLNYLNVGLTMIFYKDFRFIKINQVTVLSSAYSSSAAAAAATIKGVGYRPVLASRLSHPTGFSPT